MKQFKFITTLLILATNLFSCGATFTNNEKITGYNLTTPDKSSILPDTLREVSGLTNIDSTTFACIQDENGILFIYDARKNELKRQYTFNINGDYEGITRVSETIYVLRSDGTLFEIVNYTSDNFKLNSYDTGIPANNNEGLCYDPDNKRLLIACKGKIGKGPEYKDKRVIYGFDLQTKKLTAEPVFDFDLQKIKAYATEKNLNLPTKTRKKKGQPINEPFIKFRTSAIGIHPLTKKLYLLSASDYLLFIFDMNGDIEHIEQLNPTIFNKAEGITFYDNGDMLITNEGQDNKPTVLHFKYRKK
ncbi:MAG: hypothetical protein QY303_04720 [Vicingaceae bacterium]|nr:hypothetical protein [Flavobacteriales bacterium]WKZ76104.1 MAG: hypothetical protein QY303_04245 [Vicingaceae bacterium]WKZ76198.1 MAG: hypothetical protein QY303_04720 [Vicingaceae bacterium]